MDVSTSQYLLCFARMITSASLQDNPDKFLAFVMATHPEMQTTKQFCNKEVEVMGVDADQLQITALTDALQIGVRIEYLDGSGDTLSHIDFPEGAEPSLFLLYRPGHFDILEPRPAP